MKNYCHLHTHSHYSLLNALPKIDELISVAKKDAMEAIALTDNGNLYGAIEFYKECKKKEIKPIIGVDFFISPRTRKDKDGSIDKPSEKIILLAKNYEGYKNLIKLVTISHLEGFYYRPRIDKDLLEKYKDNLVCISPFANGQISKSLELKDFSKTPRNKR